MKRIFFCALFTLAVLAVPEAVESAEGGAGVSGARSKSLALLHQGRFDEAESVLAADAIPGRERVDQAFFLAFVTYWRLLYDDDDPALRTEFEKRLNRTILLGNRDLKNNPGDSNVALWTGSAHLLLAQLRAAQRKPFGAAFEAKKARKLLEKSASIAASRSADSAFGLGTYQYYADRVPAIVKGLRAILFIPGGNREKGLERLRQAAESSDHFALEARLLLATIYSSSHERMFGEALNQAIEATKAFPDTLAADHGAAKLEIDLFRPGSALSRLEEALERASNHPDTDRAVISTLRYHAARAEFALFRPDLSLERLRPVLESPDGTPPGLLEKIRRDADRYAMMVRNRPGWYEDVAGGLSKRISHADPGEMRRIRRASGDLLRAAEALDRERSGEFTTSSALLADMASADPEDPVLALLAGRALLISGDCLSALSHLEKADRSESLPQAWIGPCRLMAGLAADLAGRRTEAIAWYGRASRSGPFVGKDAAFRYLSEAYEGSTIGWSSG